MIDSDILRMLEITRKLQLLFALYHCTIALYIEESPVKLLEVESLADQYPATESEFRVSISDGFVS